MDKLFEKPTLFNKIFFGRYFLFSLLLTSSVGFVVPWDYFYDIDVFCYVIEGTGSIFPNVGKISADASETDKKYLVAYWAFTNIAGCVFLVFAITKIRPSDRVIAGVYEYRDGYALVAAVFAIVVALATIIVAVAGGVSGRLAAELLDSRYSWVLFRLGQWWLAGFLITISLSILSALLIKRNR